MKNSEKLLDEARKMEERLKALREAMENERAKRNSIPRTKEGFFWRAGSDGAIRNHAKEVLASRAAKRASKSNQSQSSSRVESPDDIPPLLYRPSSLLKASIDQSATTSAASASRPVNNIDRPLHQKHSSSATSTPFAQHVRAHVPPFPSATTAQPTTSRRTATTTATDVSSLPSRPAHPTSTSTLTDPTSTSRPPPRPTPTTSTAVSTVSPPTTTPTTNYPNPSPPHRSKLPYSATFPRGSDQLRRLADHLVPQDEPEDSEMMWRPAQSAWYTPYETHNRYDGVATGTDEPPTLSSSQKSLKHGGHESLLTGEVDEEANRRDFLNALLEWRSGGAGASSAPERQQPQQSQRSQGKARPLSSAPDTVSGRRAAEEAEIQTEPPTRPQTSRRSMDSIYYDELMRQKLSRTNSSTSHPQTPQA